MGVGYLIGNAPELKSRSPALHKPSIKGILLATVPAELFGEDPLQVCQAMSRTRLSLVLTKLSMDFLGVTVVTESDGGPPAAALLSYQRQEQEETTDFFTIIVDSPTVEDGTTRNPAAFRIVEEESGADDTASVAGLSVVLVHKGRHSRAHILSISTRDPIDDVEPILNSLVSGDGRPTHGATCFL